MYRSLLNTAARSSRNTSRQLSKSKRLLSSSSSTKTSSVPRWIAPSSMLALGLASYCYMSSQPVALDAKKTTSKTEKKAQDAGEATKAEEPVKKDGGVADGDKKVDDKADDKADDDKKEGNQGQEEGGQQAAFDPETGVINWDCPCLGGMAHGPCGEEFKEAFSCFVFSEAEPKGFDCIEKFKNMQNCFRRYPDVYSEEIRGDDEPVDDFNKPEDKSAAAVTPTDKQVDAPADGVIVEEVVPVESVVIEEVAVPEKGIVFEKVSTPEEGVIFEEVFVDSETSDATANQSETK